MTLLGCNALNVNALKYVSMNNGECKIRTQIISVNNNEPFIHIVLQLINTVVVVIILMTNIQNYVFLMLLKT